MNILSHNWGIGDLFYYGQVYRTWWPDEKQIPIPYKIVGKDEESGNLKSISLQGEIAHITTDTDLQHMRSCPSNEAQQFIKDLLRTKQEEIKSAKEEKPKSEELIKARTGLLERNKNLLKELGFEIQE